MNYEIQPESDEHYWQAVEDDDAFNNPSLSLSSETSGRKEPLPSPGREVRA